MYSTNSPSTERGTRRTVICAAVHGQTASKINIVSVADAPFQPPRGLWARQRGPVGYASRRACSGTLHDRLEEARNRET